MARYAPAQIVEGLVARGVPAHVAQGVVMNFMDESGLDTGIQEHAPIAGRGGFGLAQWTGPRRVALEQFSAASGKPIDDLDAQLDFFMHENATTEAPAWRAVLASPTSQDAAVNFVNKWERPASKYAAQRTAKYTGADVAAATSPYELKAQHPGRTTVGTGGYVAPGANKTQVPADKKVPTAKNWKDKIGDAVSGGFGSMAAAKAPVMGASGNAPQLPASAPIPMEAMPIVAGGAASQRDQLALLMQRLNSGQLWG